MMGCLTTVYCQQSVMHGSDKNPHSVALRVPVYCSAESLHVQPNVAILPQGAAIILQIDGLT